MKLQEGAVRAALWTACLVGWAAYAQPALSCDTVDGGLGVSRVVEIDTAVGPLYGDMSSLVREESFLGPKEVVLTFDDGPMPWVTKSILDTLDRFCTKATFFSVGRMAIAYPNSVKEVMERGHTLGTHTWSHPFNMPRMNIERARDEIERGFAAVTLAAGQPIAPFFRFPGLADSNALLGLLQSRGIGAFTVDVVSNDSFIRDPHRLTERTVEQTIARNGGILLFHDIKSSTAKALPEILAQLKEKGFKVVHMRAKAPYTPVTDYDTVLKPMLAKAVVGSKKTTAHLMPFYGVIGPEKISHDVAGPAAGEAAANVAVGEPPVTSLTPEARLREAIKRTVNPAKSLSPSRPHGQTVADNPQDQWRPRARKQKHHHRTETPLTIFD